MASESVCRLKLEFKELLGERVRRARLEAAEVEMLVVDSSNWLIG